MSETPNQGAQRLAQLKRFEDAAFIDGYRAGYSACSRRWRQVHLPRAGIFIAAVAVLACLIWWVA